MPKVGGGVLYKDGRSAEMRKKRKQVGMEGYSTLGLLLMRHLLLFLKFNPFIGE